MRLQPSSGLWLPGTKRKLQQASGLLSLMPGSAGWRQRVLSAVSRSMCCREVAGRGGLARGSSGPREDVRTVGFTGGTATCQRRSRPRQCFRLPTPLERLLSQACTCWESGERVLADRDCGPPSPSPECTAIPSAGMMPLGLSCRLRGRAQGQDMSYFHSAEFFRRAVSPLRSLSNPVHACIAHRAGSAGSRSAVLHRDLLGVLNLPCLPALHAVSSHLLNPPNGYVPFM